MNVAVVLAPGPHFNLGERLIDRPRETLRFSSCGSVYTMGCSNVIPLRPDPIFHQRCDADFPRMDAGMRWLGAGQSRWDVGGRRMTPGGVARLECEGSYGNAWSDLAGGQTDRFGIISGSNGLESDHAERRGRRWTGGMRCVPACP